MSEIITMKIVLLLGMLFLFSCKKDKNAEVFPTGTFTDVPMMVMDTGPVPVDGCDWCLKDSNDVYYSPDNLDIAYKVDRLQVFVTFKYTGNRFTCGNGIPNKGPAMVKVLGIRK